MDNMEGRLLGNASPATPWHQLDWWKSPRWIVIRIEALAVVAIIISFFLAAFGSCRRWSNRWIVQKGFFVAQVLSLSLGTYSIGLMQSSSVKSEMYPIWTVSLFTLFGCIDPVTAYHGLDYKGPLSKMVYSVCLQFGYVLLMTISTVSGHVGNTAIIALSTITVIKGFHRSLALMAQSRMRKLVQDLHPEERGEVGEDEENQVKPDYEFCRPRDPFRYGNLSMPQESGKVGEEGQASSSIFGYYVGRPEPIPNENLSTKQERGEVAEEKSMEKERGQVAEDEEGQASSSICGYYVGRPERIPNENLSTKQERGEVGKDEEGRAMSPRSTFLFTFGTEFKKRMVGENKSTLIVDFPTGTSWTEDHVNILDVYKVFKKNEDVSRPCVEACLAFGLSHKLQRYFVGLKDNNRRSMQGPNSITFELKDTDLELTFKVIEMELAFLYDIFFTGNPFLHYYQAKIASLWALASFIGICFVGVAVAIPGTVSRPPTTTCIPGDCTSIVDTTTADLVITFVILVCLALLQLMQLIRCWTSNWARVAVPCAYARDEKIERDFSGFFKKKIAPAIATALSKSADRSRNCLWACLMRDISEKLKRSSSIATKERLASTKMSYLWAWWMRTKGSVATSTNWFDKYLWQDKIGQYSVLPDVISLSGRKQEEGTKSKSKLKEILLCGMILPIMCTIGALLFLRTLLARLVKVLGLDYVWVLLWELLGKDTNKSTAVTLEGDVKASVIGFIGRIETEIIDDKWLSVPNHRLHLLRKYLPYYDNTAAHGYRYTRCVMILHIATWYCEQVEQEREKQRKAKEHRTIYIGGCGESATSCLKRASAAAVGCFSSLRKNAAGQSRGQLEGNEHRRVANALSKYCTYLVASAPELLPGSATDTYRTFTEFKKSAKESLSYLKDFKERLLGAMSDPQIWKDLVSDAKRKGVIKTTGKMRAVEEFWDAVGLAQLLFGDDPPLHGTRPPFDEIWKTLAHVWVRLLVYAAPYGNAEAHMQHLAKGGEFITHLWALLYHLDIREWKHPGRNLHFISTMEDAKSILAEDGLVVVAFLDSLSGSASGELETASNLEGDVKFYQTSSRVVARHFHIDPEAGGPALVLLYMEDKEFTSYEGIFRAYEIAYFVTSNKLAFDNARAQETAPSSVENPINKKTEDEIAKESSGDGVHGQTKDEIEEISPVSS